MEMDGVGGNLWQEFFIKTLRDTQTETIRRLDKHCAAFVNAERQNAVKYQEISDKLDVITIQQGVNKQKINVIDSKVLSLQRYKNGVAAILAFIVAIIPLVAIFKNQIVSWFR